jgi:hypothetical protein
MEPLSCRHICRRIVPLFLVSLLLLSSLVAKAASLQTFAVVFGQVTNDLAILEASFDGSSGQRQLLAALVRARAAILDPDLRDEQALVKLVDLLGSNGAYDATLDESARNARAAVLSQHDVMALRVADLPPSRKTSLARARFNDLSGDAQALAVAQNAGGIAALLGPFGRRLASIEQSVRKAEVMPKPRVGLNAVRAKVNGRRFASSGVGRPTPNEFSVQAGPGYLEVNCRVIDGERVITFALPVLTEDASYEVEAGLVSLAYVENIFDATPEVPAVTGTFYVQRDRREIYGIFSVAGSGLDVKDGRFRIQLPRELRGK